MLLEAKKSKGLKLTLVRQRPFVSTSGVATLTAFSFKPLISLKTDLNNLNNNDLFKWICTMLFSKNLIVVQHW